MTRSFNRMVLLTPHLTDLCSFGRKIVADRIISKPPPPRLADLYQLDFDLWRATKSSVYRDFLRTLGDSKAMFIRSISSEK